MITQVTTHTHAAIRRDANILNEAIIAAFDDDCTRDHMDENGRTVRNVQTLEETDFAAKEFYDTPIGCEITLNNGERYVIQIWHRR